MRDCQYRTHQWVQDRAWDGSTPFGPVIVEPREVDIRSGTLRTTLNSSEFTRLAPGDVILTGTQGELSDRLLQRRVSWPGLFLLVVGVKFAEMAIPDTVSVAEARW